MEKRQLQERVQQMQARLDTLEEAHECMVCFDAKATVLFRGCRHVVTCETCANRVHQCPYCRAYILSRETVIFA